MPTNVLDQPIGPSLGDWRPPPFPAPIDLAGRTVRLEPLDPSVHAPPLFDAFIDAPDSLWTYLQYGPFADVEELRAALCTLCDSPEQLPFAAVVDGRPVGYLAYLRIVAVHGVIEIGSVAFAPELQRTTAATEAVSLLITHAFDLGFRRVEWKCDDLNARSRVAAERFGFRYEGTFRKAVVYKGRSRDTAWLAITDDEWPAVAAAHRSWLAPENFDTAGRQRTRLTAPTKH